MTGILSFGRRDPLQLQLELEGPPRDAPELLARLRSLGLHGIETCRLTDNKSVLVSHRGTELRVHRAYLEAPAAVLEAIVRFVCAYRRRDQLAARRVLTSFPIKATPGTPRRLAKPHPDDVPLAQELVTWHWRYNARYFAGVLSPISIIISGRMRTRLGQYSASDGSEPATICISRSHIRHHGWAEALHTLLHEMVHQWQAETGRPIDHGADFREKAIEVGIAASARREMDGRAARQRLA
ncbi:MAG TPA: SprT-like domain-containing protein [Gemmatimonadaceae bacterium]|nr:SprT-like domain-containing protein [Gemmatimonadaceae bacterium]